MTKYEWERELKRNLAALPSDEVAKVLDYYDELFEDKSESGKSESYIIREFGNPFDVARRIMNEFEAENGRPVTDNAGADKSHYDDVYRGGYSQDEVDNMPFFQAIKINLKKHVNKVKRKLVGTGSSNAETEAVSKPESAPEQKREVSPWDNPIPKAETDARDNSIPKAKESDPWGLPQEMEYDEGYSFKRHSKDRVKREGRERKRESYSDYKADIERERAQIEKERRELENEKKQLVKKTRGGCARVMAKLIFFIPFMIFAITGWSVVLSLLAAGVGCVGGGIVYAIAPLIGFGGVFLVQLGGGLVCTGVGLLLTVGSIKLVKLFWIMTLRYFGVRKQAEKSEQGGN